MFDFVDREDGKKASTLLSVAKVLTDGQISDYESLSDLYKFNPRVASILCEASSLIDFCYNGNKLF